MTNFSVLITTCDDFSDLWGNNKILFDKYWKNHPNIFIISDKKNDYGRTIFANFLHCEKNYSSRLLFALKNIETKYVFVTLDDYLICNSIEQINFDKILFYMDKFNLSYLRLFKRTKTKGWIDKKSGLHLISYNKNVYEVNLYPSIWRREDLIKLIGLCKIDEDPWKFEVRMTRRAKELKLKSGWMDNRKIYPFVDTVRKGKYIRSAYRFLKREELFIGDRMVRTLKETITLNMRTIIARLLPTSLKNKLKKKTRKFYFSNCWNSDD